MKLLTCVCVFVVIFCFVSINAEEKEENESKVQMTVMREAESCPRKTQNGDLITVHYVGFLESGKQIDSTYEREKPIFLQLGKGHAIGGWEEGLVDMCVGEKRKLIIPPGSGYGAKDHGEIPAGSTLEFHIELLNIQKGESLKESFNTLDDDKNGFLDMNEVAHHLDKAASVENLPVKIDHSMKYKLLQTMFMQLDQDRDGQLDQDEFDVLQNLAKNFQEDQFKNLKVEL